MANNLPASIGPLPPTSSGVTQAGNQSGGHLAGNDVNLLQVAGDYIQAPPPERITALGRLYRKLKNDSAGDPILSDYISQLEIFTRTVEDEQVVGLDGKFIASSRQDQLDMAKAMKEMIYSQIRQNMFSRTFQTIYATLMGKIYELFQTWVRPAILKGEPREIVDMIVHNRIIAPLVEELEGCSDYDGVAVSEIRGMVYFLTGNCHLCWH